MPTNTTAPGFADRLCSLAESQLQMQTARSVALDASALGVMAVDATLAAIVLSTGRTHLWLTALSLLSLSFLLAAGVPSLPRAGKTGPFAPDMFDALETRDDRELKTLFVTEVSADMRMNRGALARKTPLFNAALTFLVLAITVDLTGRL